MPHDSHQWANSFPWSLTYSWGHTGLTVDFDLSGDVPRLLCVRRPGDPEPGPEEAKSEPSLPLVDLVLLGDGTGWSGPRFAGTALGRRLRYRAHHSTYGDGWHRLTFELRDPGSGLTVFADYASPDGVSVLRSRVRVRNDGGESVILRSVRSLLVGGFPSPDELFVFTARNDWGAECRWGVEPLRDSVPDINREAHGHTGHAAKRLAGHGSWPTDGHLAMGALQHRTDSRSWVWQIESASSWVWEAGESGGRTCLALGGPTHDEHQWRQVLEPGGEFASEWVALALGTCFDGAVAALTSYRRVVRRPHEDHERLPVVFNDYMNTLMGDPTAEKLLPLIDAAADVGAEYFCVDAGWYDEGDGGWWDSVGEWLPSARRFPGDGDEPGVGGLRVVLDRIRERGMVPGLWLEPEVVGVRSPLARELPDEAFLRYADGTRVTEQGRHQLDLTHPAARTHLDKTVDRIVGEWGVGYLKLDYNITTSVPGHLAHARAWLSWLSSVLDRHPGLVVENCASGGMRMDGASLAVAQLQSTSDQQDPLRYPPIAASAPTAVPPEQSAVWAYPQPTYTDAEIAFTLGSALLGRIHLSGHLDRMTDRQRGLVRDALDTYKSIRPDLRSSVPFWPLGLPGWTDDWVVSGLRQPGADGEGAVYITVWRRGGDDAERSFPIPHLGGGEAGGRGREVRVEVLHPRRPGAGPSGTAETAEGVGATGATGSAEWDGSELRVRLPEAPAILLLRLTAFPAPLRGAGNGATSHTGPAARGA
ncbi:glycoside hydrolase family 36 protein [Streptomyces ipomoeae]|uniref:glycoside hydrolase family 36 protein n=1 Tax=Streptomyces ipomoeae TaxID=103232 RepID=UPI0011473370|nr:glycoside hydrolase family 36 protein [Streptomyces ipomoeae]MDX2939661.1 alpha-galactosidase [Streptomyces ipomoeae]TQE23479.1 alpha-galactosidase [Streptomyces ipomoeae]